ncbi:hypothetical protein FAM22021_001105 [Propionibacterium freudenreichii]|nr:hypothetical protein [Propionibacterium freudenreichii]
MGDGMISSWSTDRAPCRSAVPRQSLEVSPAPDDDDVLSGGHDLVGNLAAQRLGRLGQELHRLVDAAQLAAGNRQLHGGCRADRQHDRIEALEQLLTR